MNKNIIKNAALVAAFGIAGLVAGTRLHRSSVGPRVVSMAEADQVAGGDIFSSCSQPTCAKYGHCSFASGLGLYISDPVDSTKSCAAAIYPYCSDNPKPFVCTYTTWYDSSCTQQDGTMTSSNPFCALIGG